MHRVLVLLLVLQPALVFSQMCATGWTLYGDSCFKLSSDSKNFYEAQITCQNDGGTLAMPKTADINNFLSQMTQAATPGWDYLIGIHDVSLEGNFIWVDNTPLEDPTQWNPGEPNDYGNYEDCTELLANGRWNDLDCYRVKAYICQRDNDVVIKCDEGNGWISAAGKCYKYYGTAKSWPDAENYCNSIDGNLMSIISEDEQMVATTQVIVAGNTIWIGLTDNIQGQAGSYSWSTGQSLTYTHWGLNQPDNSHFPSGGDCVEILDTSNNGEWTTNVCSASQRFMCERAEGTCADGWRLFRGYCYQFNSISKVTWTDAKHTCEAQGAYLTTIFAGVENDFIRDQFTELEGVGITNTWIGLSDTETDGSLAWNEGSTVGYVNWYPGQPVDTADAPDCGSMLTAGGDGRWSTQNCFTLEAYVCKARVGTAIYPLDPSIGIGSCDAGWTLNRDWCYKVDTTQLFFNDAENNCQLYGGHLTSVLDQDEQSFLSMRSGLANVYLWIGLHDVSLEGNFIWTDGEAFVFNNWAANQPDNWGSAEDCVHMRPFENEEGEWNDIDCDNTQFGFVCKKAKTPGGSQAPPAVPTPEFNSRCGSGWEYDSRTGNCYLFKATDYMNWQDARMACRVGGGDLLSIADETEQTYINARLVYVTQSGMWIGANDLTSEGGWGWSDGSGFAYLNWNPGEPNNAGSGEHCVQAYESNGKWNDLFCDRTMGYICKKNGYLTRHFNVFPNAFLSDSNTLIIPAAYPEDCAQACVHSTTFTCRSFNYMKQTMDCNLSDSTKDMGGNLITDPTTDYYERIMDVVDPFHTTLPPNYHCRPGWYSYGSNCYWVNIGAGTYDQARSYCQSLVTGTQVELASIHDANENSFLQTLFTTGGITSAIWIGLNDLRVQMQFEWSDSTPVDYTNWNNHEPNNYGDAGEDCTEMLQSGVWNDISCSNIIPSICKMKKEDLPPTDQPITPSGCSLGEVAYGSSCYQVRTSAKQWVGAQADCQSIGGNLVSVADRYEQSVVSSMLGLQDGTLVWIGLNDLNVVGQYSWSDNTPVTYTNWDLLQPDDSAGYCVASSSGTTAGLWKNIDCNSIQNYMCERVRDGYTPRPTVPPPQPPTQPSNNDCYYGWVGYGAWCFKIESADSGDKVRRPWAAARSVCMAIGGDLASFHSQAEVTYITSQMPNTNIDYWIGLHDRSAEKGFEWTDGTPVDYSNWRPGEPNNVGFGGEDCTEMSNSVNGGWNDENCQALRNWICKIGKGVIPLTTPVPTTVTPWPQCPTDPDWVMFKDYCYFFSGGLSSDDRKRSWSDANSYCMQNKGYLTSVHSSDENNFIKTMLVKYPDSHEWIGLREYGGNGIYQWSDGTPLDYQAWAPGEPNDANGEEECAQIYIDGSWNDLNCGDTLTFICRKHVTNVLPKTPAPTSPPVGNCGSDYLRFDNRCYRITGAIAVDRSTWYQGRDVCRNTYGGDLATIHNQALQSFFITQMKGIGYRLYIGLSDSLTTGQFRWTDGSSVDYTNWAYNEPNEYGGDEDCVEMMQTIDQPGRWNDISCNNNNGYICQVDLDPSAPDQPDQPGSCRQGFTQYYDSCFKVISRSMTFADANQACRNEGQDVRLASIIDNYEQAYAETLVHYNGESTLWLGLVDDKLTGLYKWVDGYPVWYTYWGQREPSQGAGEGCVAMGLSGWDDSVCTTTYGALCKYSLVPIPTEHPDMPGTCPDTWTAYGSNCYLFSKGLTDFATWPAAQFICSTNGGDLASVHSKQENEWIRGQIAQLFYDAWIGLMASPSSSFTWSDDTPFDYVNWSPGEPNSNFPGHEDCAELYSDSGRWNDLDCLTPQGYVCKVPKTPLSNMPTIARPITTPVATTKQPIGVKTTPENPLTQGTQATKGNTVPPVTDNNIPPMTTNNDNEIQPSLTPGGIAGIVIGCLIAVCLAALLAVLIYTKQKEKSTEKTPAAPATSFNTGFDNVVYEEKNATNLTTFDSKA